jgi:EREBP-like factor
MAEWKTMDKEILLRTFETEEGAARALDAARKLLKCKKKRPANFPCIELVAYLEQIPLNLNLKNLGNNAMFKDVTLFVKLKAEEYVVNFFPPHNNHRSSNL